VEQTFTDMLLSYKPQLQRKAVVEKQKVERKDGTGTSNTGDGGNTGGNGGTGDDLEG